MFKQLNNNFKVDERVQIGMLGGDELENRTGIILGKSIEGFVDYYIVLLDIIANNGCKAVSMPEVCLQRI